MFEDMTDSMSNQPYQPNPARMYDYFLGGSHNTQADRRLAEQVIAVYPDVVGAARCNRAFLRRALEFVLDQGIDQVLDLGAGIPTVGNTHELVAQHNPHARVVYVDSDPVAALMCQRLVADCPNVAALQADVRFPQTILTHPEVQRLLDLRKPVALVMVALLHFIPDTREASAIVRAFADAVPEGSYLVMTHGTDEQAPPDIIAQLKQLYNGSSTAGGTRSYAEIAAFFAGFQLVPPGLVFTPRRRPDGLNEPFCDQPERSLTFAAVGRKSGPAA
jgi:hypothetical protein